MHEKAEKAARKKNGFFCCLGLGVESKLPVKSKIKGISPDCRRGGNEEKPAPTGK
ncbi:MAG: hypothetical protein II828_08690 [Clostridia bacterium]|nr:hypothetical protein [Clostridia bacterium]